MTPDCLRGYQPVMEISTKNDEKTIGTAILPKHEDTRTEILPTNTGTTEKRKPAKPPRPRSSELKSSVAPGNTNTWSSTYPPKLESYPEPNPLFYRTLTASRKKTERKAFLRPTEHILGTFYGIVSRINGKDWIVLNSEYLPIYFVRVSVKNAKYPFRILVIDDELTRVVDFIVSSNTKTSIKEDAVCWEYKETFGVKFAKKSQAVQFHDTISRMISTLKKGEQLENEHLDKMLNLEVHFPNSQVNTYQFLKSTKLKDILKFICKKAHLRVNDHYLSYMGITDDTLDMDLRVGEIRTNSVRLVSNRGLRSNSTDMLEKVSKRSSQKDRGFFSFIRRRFSRKSKGSTMYRSAPSVLQYTDNIFMVERQPDQNVWSSLEANLEKSGNEPRHSSTLPAKKQASEKTRSPHVMTEGRVKRRAPLPPKLDISKENKENNVTANQSTEKKIKRRAPSPPRSEEPGIDKKRDLPVFIAPPPPETEPPPIEECETPVGPIDTDLDDIPIESPDTNKGNSDTNSIAEVEEKISLAEETLQNGTKDEICVDKVEDNNMEKNGNLETEKVDESNVNNEEKNETDTVSDSTPIAENDKENINDASVSEQSGNLSSEELKISEAIKSLSPQQLQALFSSKDGSNQPQQDTANIQNQQFMYQQQFISNLLLQQMLQQQQMSQQRPPQVVPVVPMATAVHPQPVIGGVVHHPMQPGMILPMHSHGTWGGIVPGQTVTPVPSYSNLPAPSPTVSQNQINNGPTETEKTTTEITKDKIPEPMPQNDPKEEDVKESAKVEELVNRPLFKKMLAQVSQGKVKDIPKEETNTSKGGTALISVPTNAKIGKVPTSYVESAEKNVFEVKDETKEKKEHVTLGQIGKKSSYVDSAIDCVGKGSPIVSSEEKISSVVDGSMKNSVSTGTVSNNEGMKTPVPASNVYSNNEGMNNYMSTGNVSNKEIVKNPTSVSNFGKPVVDVNPRTKTVNTISPIVTSEKKLPAGAVKTDQTNVVNANDMKYTPLASIYEKKATVIASRPTEGLSASIQNTTSPIKVQHQKVPIKTVETDQTIVLGDAGDMKYSALSKVYEKKAAIASAGYSKPYSPSVQNRLTPSTVGEKKTPVVAAKPVRSVSGGIDKKGGEITPKGGQTAAVQNTTHRKLQIMAPPVPTKPSYQRQKSEPVDVSKPSIGPKPASRPMEKRKTLPKSAKDQRMHISLSLTPEERKLLPKLSAGGTNAPVKTGK